MQASRCLVGNTANFISGNIDPITLLRDFTTERISLTDQVFEDVKTCLTLMNPITPRPLTVGRLKSCQRNSTRFIAATIGVGGNQSAFELG
jgi:hypothetical protein